MALAAHSWPPINTMLEVDGDSLDQGPSPSSNVAESLLAAVETPLISQILYLRH